MHQQIFLTFPAKAGTHFSTIRKLLEQSQYLESGDGFVPRNDRPRLSPGKRITSESKRLGQSLEPGADGIPAQPALAGESREVPTPP